MERNCPAFGPGAGIWQGTGRKHHHPIAGVAMREHACLWSTVHPQVRGILRYHWRPQKASLYVLPWLAMAQRAPPDRGSRGPSWGKTNIVSSYHAMYCHGPACTHAYLTCVGSIRRHWFAKIVKCHGTQLYGVWPWGRDLAGHRQKTSPPDRRRCHA